MVLPILAPVPYAPTTTLWPASVICPYVLNESPRRNRSSMSLRSIDAALATVRIGLDGLRPSFESLPVVLT